jgi:C4-dicarboxylate-specific signal transduction histidine kinase
MRKSSVTICSDSLISSAVDACLDKVSEDRRVDAHLRSARSFVNSTADNFWANSAKARKLTVLQDWVTQASTLAKSSRAALAIVHQVMFPLNNQPVGLSALLSHFEDGEAIYRFVREHL